MPNFKPITKADIEKQLKKHRGYIVRVAVNLADSNVAIHDEVVNDVQLTWTRLADKTDEIQCVYRLRAYVDGLNVVIDELWVDLKD